MGHTESPCFEVKKKDKNGTYIIGTREKWAYKSEDPKGSKTLKIGDKKRILRKCNQSGIDGVTANLRTQVLENKLI